MKEKVWSKRELRHSIQYRIMYLMMEMIKNGTTSCWIMDGANANLPVGQEGLLSRLPPEPTVIQGEPEARNAVILFLMPSFSALNELH